MRFADARLAPAPGDGGLVCRTAGAVLFIAARTPPAAVADLVARVSANEEDQPGRSLARNLAGLVGADDGTMVPPFALVASSRHGLAVMVYGNVDVRLHDAEGEQVLSAAGSLTWVDRELPGPFTAIVAHRSGEPPPAAALDLDLSGGTVAADGFALSTLTEATASPLVAAPSTTDGPLVPEPDPKPAPAPGPVEPSPDPVPPGPAPEPAPTPLPEPEPVPKPAMDAPPLGASQVFTAPPLADPPAGSPVADAPPAASPAVEAPPGWDVPTQAAPVEPPPADEPSRDKPVSEPVTDPPAARVVEQVTIPPSSVDADFDSVLLGALDSEEPDSREPLPIEPDPGEVREPEQSTSDVQVQGVICSRGHFNDPRSRYCSSCGIGMVQQTQVLTPGPRPPLGVLVFEDGATFSLSSDYVIGRQPESSELVASGEAMPLQVDDPERSISRAHAEVRLVDWNVHLVNLSHTNGSFVWDVTSNQWVPIPAGQSVVLQPGWRIALGRRSAVFESSLVR